MILNMNNNIFKIDLIPDNTEISISEDETILTASLRNDIQHHHACGGLGMCSTCRVEIIEGEDNLSPKSKSEQNLSKKLELPSNIRLACQTKIKGNVKLKRLLLDQKDLILANQMTKNSVGSIGSTKNLALMFVDIVSFTPLSEQLPSYDVMYILNRYFDDMGTIIKINGGDPANFLDVGGAASAETVKNGFKIILRDKNVKSILINIFGGIVRCDRVAEGVIQAVKELSLDVPVVVRLEGTNSELAKQKISDSGLEIIPADSMLDAAIKVVKASKN